MPSEQPEVPETPKAPDLDYDHDALRTRVLQLKKLEQAMLGLGNQRGAMERDGMPEILLTVLDNAIEQIRPTVDAMKRGLPKYLGNSRLRAWLEGTAGLGPGLVMVIGSMPPLTAFATPGRVMSYLGLHVGPDGHAVRIEKGKKAGFASFRRGWALYRVGEPMVKSRGAYRHLYDRRKEETLVPHPPMLENGQGCDFCDAAYAKTKEKRAQKAQTRERTQVAVDCANMGGVHWTPGHRANDGLRVMTKAIMLDAHRIVWGLVPLYGQPSPEAIQDDDPTSISSSEAAD